MGVFHTKFTTTTQNEVVCRSIALMTITKQFFEYEPRARGGIPLIHLAGSKDDWVTLKHSIDNLKIYMMADFASKWLPTLHSIVDMFIMAFDGRVDKEFWGSMVTHHKHGSRITGWVNGLFPYLQDKPNKLCVPWGKLKTMAARKTKANRASAFARRFCAAPMEWNLHGMDIRSSIMGARFVDGTVIPQISWAVVKT